MQQTTVIGAAALAGFLVSLFFLPFGTTFALDDYFLHQRTLIQPVDMTSTIVYLSMHTTTLTFAVISLLNLVYP